MPRSRRWITDGIINSTDTTPILIIGPNSGLGQSIGETFHIWGVQLADSEQQTTYIPTTTAAATRNAEALNLLPPPITTDFGVVLDIVMHGDAADMAQIRLFGTDDSRGTTFELRTNTAIAWAFVAQAGGGFFNMNAADLPRGQTKVAFQIVQNGADADWVIVQDGTVRASGTAVGFTLDHSNNNTFSLGTWPAGITGTAVSFRGVQLFDREQTTAKLQELTS